MTCDRKWTGGSSDSPTLVSMSGHRHEHQAVPSLQCRLTVNCGALASPACCLLSQAMRPPERSAQAQAQAQRSWWEGLVRL